MSAHVIGNNPNSLAFGAPLLACTRRAAAKDGLGGLVYVFPYNAVAPRFPETHSSFSLSNTNKHVTINIFLRADETTLYHGCVVAASEAQLRL